MKIIEEEKQTKEKTELRCKYSDLFKIMNKLTNLIKDIQAVDEYLSPSDEENIRKDVVKKLSQIIDDTQESIKYAKKKAEQEKPLWQTGDLDRIIDTNKL